MQTFVYEVLDGGTKVGISIAPDAATALDRAHKAFTRRTSSKMDETCDYDDLWVSRMPIFTRSRTTAPAPAKSTCAATPLAA